MLSIRCCKYSVRYLHNFQHLSLYSTNSSNQNPKFPNHSYTNYLINHLGFSHQQAQSIYTKLRCKSAADARFSKFSGNADSVIDFLKQRGFDGIHIKKAVSYFPRILSAKVDETLKPKFKVFQDHGFSESDLVSVISSSPAILSYHMDPIIRDLRVILGSNDNIMKFLRKSYFIGPSALGNLNSNVSLLNKEYGLAINVIRNGILQSPKPYMKDTKFFQNTLVKVEKELGIPRNSGMFVYGIRLLCEVSKKGLIESKCEVLKSFGWTEYDVSELMRRYPIIFTISEENFRKKLGFLMTELGYKPDYLFSHSMLLSYSLEKRLAPRHRVLLFLKENGLLDYNFYAATIKSEKKFLEILIEPFKKDAPGLLKLYQSSKGYSNIDAISRQSGINNAKLSRGKDVGTEAMKALSDKVQGASKGAPSFVSLSV